MKVHFIGELRTLANIIDEPRNKCSDMGSENISISSWQASPIGRMLSERALRRGVGLGETGVIYH